MNSVRTVGVIGAGDFGLLAAEKLSPSDSEVLVFDKNDEAELPNNANWASFGKVASSDVVILAVPFDSYVDVIPKLAESASEDSLIVDVCSVKMKPTEVFESHGLLSRANVLMTHPLFGPQTVSESIAGKNLVVTESRGGRAIEILKFWDSEGVSIFEMSAEDHDKEMARVQVLPFMIGRTLLNMGISESDLATQYYSKLLALVDVERLHSPELFDTIQRHNPFASSIRAELISALCKQHIQIELGDRELDGLDDMEIFGKCRGVLDIVDNLRTMLLEPRFVATRKIGEIKARNSMPSVDPAREKAQLERLEGIAADLNVPAGVASASQRPIIDAVVRQHNEIKAGTLGINT